MTHDGNKQLQFFSNFSNTQYRNLLDKFLAFDLHYSVVGFFFIQILILSRYGDIKYARFIFMASLKIYIL